MVTHAGISGVVTVVPIVVGEILSNAGILFDTHKTVNRLPTGYTIGDMVIQNAADTVILTKVRIQMKPFVFISCDKGNKKGNTHLAKYICWYYKQDKRVNMYLLDV